MLRARSLATVFAILAGAACARVPSGPLPLAPGAPGTDATAAVTATVVIKIPSVVKDADGLAIVAHKPGKNATLASATASIAARSRDCKNVAGGRRCSIALTLKKPGTYAFKIAVYDRKPHGGKISPLAHEIAAGTAIADLKKSRDVPAAIGGIVAKTGVALAMGAGPAIDPLSTTASVSVLDADDNAILTKTFVDSAGKRVTIAMQADSTAGTTIAFSPAMFGVPVDSVVITYTPGLMNAQQATNGFSTVLSAVASNGAPASGATLALNAPAFTVYPTLTSASKPAGIVSARRALWFVEYQGNNIGRITTSGSMVEYSATVGGAAPAGVALGADGNMWFTAQTGNSIGRVTRAGAVKTFPLPSPSSRPNGIVGGPDGALWFTEISGNKIGRVPTSGSPITEYAIPTANSYTQSITAGPDGALWFAECTVGKIGRIPVAGSPIKEYTLLSGIQPLGIIAGPDRALWFTTCSKDIGRITTSGSVAYYPVPGKPDGIAVGPDGAIWFGLLQPSPLPQSIGRLSIDGSVLTTYTLSGTNPFPDGLANGPDGAIWITDSNASDVRRLQ